MSTSIDILGVKELTPEDLLPATMSTDEEYVIVQAIKKYLLHMSKNNVESLKTLGYMTDDESITHHALTLKPIAFAKDYSLSTESLFNSLFK